MSAQSMAEVLLKSKAKGNAKLVLLAIASYADDAGAGACPSLTTLTTLTGLSRRTICSLLAHLAATAQLTIQSATAP